MSQTESGKKRQRFLPTINQGGGVRTERPQLLPLPRLPKPPCEARVRQKSQLEDLRDFKRAEQTKTTQDASTESSLRGKSKSKRAILGQKIAEDITSISSEIERVTKLVARNQEQMEDFLQQRYKVRQQMHVAASD